jgi:hypothetical protein
MQRLAVTGGAAALGVVLIAIILTTQTHLYALIYGMVCLYDGGGYHCRACLLQ